MRYWGGVAANAVGNAYVTGATCSSDFPTTAGAFDRTFNGGFADAFATKLNSAGSALVYSTFLGGAETDNGQGIALDAGGNAYVTGNTRSTDFPTTAGVFDRTYNGLRDAFVAKLKIGEGIVCGGLAATLVGTQGNDALMGTLHDDVIAGLGGNDGIRGVGGDDSICGGDGDDIIEGGRGHDVLLGEGGSDLLDGGSNTDQLIGGTGNDQLFGRAANDELYGGSGNDQLDGGIDQDFCNAASGTDTAVNCEVVNGVP